VALLIIGGRQLTLLGHDVKLIAPQLVKPYVKRGKNDAADAEALCEVTLCGIIPLSDVLRDTPKDTPTLAGC